MNYLILASSLAQSQAPQQQLLSRLFSLRPFCFLTTVLVFRPLVCENFRRRCSIRHLLTVTFISQRMLSSLFRYFSKCFNALIDTSCSTSSPSCMLNPKPATIRLSRPSSARNIFRFNFDDRSSAAWYASAAKSEFISFTVCIHSESAFVHLLV